MNIVTDIDRRDYAEADRMVREGKALRQRVNTRIRNRKWRQERKAI